MDFERTNDLIHRAKYYLTWEFVLSRGKIIKARFKPKVRIDDISEAYRKDAEDLK